MYFQFKKGAQLNCVSSLINQVGVLRCISRFIFIFIFLFSLFPFPFLLFSPVFLSLFSDDSTNEEQSCTKILRIKKELSTCQSLTHFHFSYSSEGVKKKKKLPTTDPWSTWSVVQTTTAPRRVLINERIPWRMQLPLLMTTHGTQPPKWVPTFFKWVSTPQYGSNFEGVETPKWR